jgi:quercetin dioxygenase-like cupin family protein
MRFVTLPLILAASAALSAQTAPAPAAANNRVPLENDDVRVVRALERPHVKGRPHKHDQNRVMIYFQGGTQEFIEDGKKTVLTYKTGDVLWSPATGMHEPTLLTDEPVNIVEVLLKKPGGGKKVKTALDPVKVDPKHYKVEMENDQVRVLRVKFGAGEGAPLHEHQLNRVLVLLTDQNIRITGTGGDAFTVSNKAGEVSWGLPVKHSEANLNKTPFEAIMVELK